MWFEIYFIILIKQIIQSDFIIKKTTNLNNFIIM